MDRRLGRREVLLGAAGLAAAALLPRSVRAEEVFLVGLVVPADPAATALQQGAGLGLDDANALAALFGKRLKLEIETAADAPAAARAGRALARAGALAVLGGAGPGSADALVDVAGEGAVFLNVAAPDDRLRNERCGRRVFHLVPSVSMSVDALAHWLVERRRLARLAFISDGSSRAHEIEAAARRSLPRRGGTLVTDATGADVRLLAVDDRAAGPALSRALADGRSPVAGLGGAVPLGLGPEEAAGLWVVGWHHELQRFSGRELNGRFRRRFAAPMTEGAWTAWAAVKLLGEAVIRGGVSTPEGLVRFLESAPPFDGHKGEALTFRPWDHQLRQPLHVIGPRPREEVGGRRGPFAVLGDVGGGNLDALGTSMADTRCWFGP